MQPSHLQPRLYAALDGHFILFVLGALLLHKE
jgi:hypothetical protein